MYRPRNIILALLAAVVLYAGYLIYWAYTAEPNPTVDYAAQLEQLSAEAQPPGENAWPLLEQVYAKLDELEKAFPADQRPAWHNRNFDFDVLRGVTQEDLELLGESASPEEIRAAARQAVQWLEDNGAFDLVAQASQRPNFVRPLDNSTSLIEVLLPDLSKARNLARARSASVRLAIDRGDHDEVLRGIDEMFYLGSVYTHQAILIDALVGYAIHRFALNDLNHWLQRTLPGPNHLNEAMQIIRQHEIGPISLAFEGERRTLLDMSQRVYTDEGNGEGTLLLTELQSYAGGMLGPLPKSQKDTTPLMNIVGLFYADRKSVTEKTNDWFDHLIAMTDKPLPARRDMTISPDKRIDNLGWRYTPLMIAAPALHKAIDQWDLAQTVHAGSTVMVAIELYRAQHGNYPQSLDQLTPDVLEQLPDDRVSGKPFGYRVLENDPHGRAYLLYALGRDATDNQGHYPEDSPFAAFKEDEAQGNDYVFNRPLE